MNKNYKPGHSSTASPYLIVDGANETIEFLKEVFGAVEVRRFSDAEGKIRHAEVGIDDSVIMIAEGGPAWPPMQAHVHVYVPDVDATYRRALEAGAVSVQEPVKKEDEDKRGGVRRRRRHDLVDRNENGIISRDDCFQSESRFWDATARIAPKKAKCRMSTL